MPYAMASEVRVIQSVWFTKTMTAGLMRVELDRIFIASWCLSITCLSKLYMNTYCYTDSIGMELATDILRLPYKRVLVSFTEEVINYDVWSLNKLYVYSLQKVAFVHVDNDVFLYLRLDHEFISASMLCQTYERGFPWYKDTLRTLVEADVGVTEDDFYDAHHAQTPESIDAVNAGIIGGSSLKIFQRSYRIAKNIQAQLARLDLGIKTGHLNIFLEQWILSYVSTLNDTVVKPLFDFVTTPDFVVPLNSFYKKYENRGYVHLMASKSHVTTQESVLKELWHLSDSLFCRMHDKLHFDYFVEIPPGNFSMTTEGIGIMSGDHNSNYNNPEVLTLNGIRELINSGFTHGV